jgi:hypothetical protein
MDSYRGFLWWGDADPGAREIEKADDEKREAEARDVIEGKHRIKRKGQDFFSGDEEEENETGRKKWSKKMLKKRKLEREDGLHKLGRSRLGDPTSIVPQSGERWNALPIAWAANPCHKGPEPPVRFAISRANSVRFADGEVNVFVDAYEQDMDSDGDDIEEVAGFSDREREDSPPTYSARDAYTLVRAAAKRNRGVSDGATMSPSFSCLPQFPITGIREKVGSSERH